MKIILATILTLCSLLVCGQNVVRDVDAETFSELMKNKKAVVIDLRTTDEIIKKGKIKGPKQIDFLGDDAETQINALDKTKPTLIYCAGGGRSSECAEIMKNKGFKEVVNLKRGYDDWKRKGFEIEE